ncbi:hypothetical protein cypCar_00048103 [Cyprinus carpio]|nr:hypothetical protein cypCar_00048103 [Cyprinus carpio]
MLAKYPQSLQDVIEGDVIGPGYHSLVKQLQARIENVKRSSLPRILKRKRVSDEYDTDEIPAERRAAVQDTYGCIQWDMKFMPISETLESQQEKKDKLKMLSEQATFSPEELEGCSEDVKDLVLLILSYFNEKEENLFCYVEETCTAKEVQVESLPGTPCVIVCGTSCYAAKQFMLSVDQKIVNDQIPNFISAVCMMFGSFYCLNTHYPVDLGSTLEFLQRCFFSINPEKGTKVEMKKNKKQLSVNPRVLTLVADLSDHEWRETC